MYIRFASHIEFELFIKIQIIIWNLWKTEYCCFAKVCTLWFLLFYQIFFFLFHMQFRSIWVNKFQWFTFLKGKQIKKNIYIASRKKPWTEKGQQIRYEWTIQTWKVTWRSYVTRLTNSLTRIAWFQILNE